MSVTAQDKILLKRLSNQDSGAIEQLYTQHYSLIESIVLRNNGDRDDAKDLFQECLIVLYQKSISPDFELNCQLGTFLFSVAKRLWIKKLKDKTRIFSYTDELEQHGDVDFDEEKHRQEQKKFDTMQVAMEKLGEPCKSLLDAFYIHKMPMQQIAEQFNYTNADNAKTQKYKCLMRLKKIFFAEQKSGG